MTITERVARKKPGRDYDMDYYTFAMSVEDLPPALVAELTHVEIWRLVNFIVMRECVNWVLQNGYEDIEVVQTRMAYWRQCLGEKVLAKATEYGV